MRTPLFLSRPCGSASKCPSLPSACAQGSSGTELVGRPHGCFANPSSYQSLSGIAAPARNRISTSLRTLSNPATVNCNLYRVLVWDVMDRECFQGCLQLHPDQLPLVSPAVEAFYRFQSLLIGRVPTSYEDVVFVAEHSRTAPPLV